MCTKTKPAAREKPAQAKPCVSGPDTGQNRRVGIECLPCESIATILDGVGDRDYCHCLQASALFWGASSDAAVEARKRRWSGCREPHDFCATGNVEALSALSSRGQAFDVRLCVVNALAHGHGDVVLDFLQDDGRIGDDNSTIDGEWHQEACREAAKNGRLDVLATLWDHQLGADTVVDGAVRGDRLDVFLWACEVRGFPPARRDLHEAIFHDAVAILTHCRRSMTIPQAEWSHMATSMAGHPCRIDVLFVLMGESAPVQVRKKICSLMCGRAPLRDIKALYTRFPDAFDEWCLFSAAAAGDLEVARWLCDRNPQWVDDLISVYVGLVRPHAKGYFADPHVGVDRLYRAGLIGDVTGLVGMAAARGAVDLMARVIDNECRKHFSTDVPADAPAEPLSRGHYRHLPADILSAAATGALARLSSIDNDRGPYDWLDARGLIGAPFVAPS
ncbi:hypothetical protein psal_cds_1106 [Pandoravirus salinus]|uniref:Ankyrin repeat domain containing protein n=1 Tax=Pandoravirus salinus TaxID=1349410 RepID=S4W3S5_9VIRU|nr:hypothetical protein psal_cds_1106 [Pandoravirus salinus]AGO85332.1 hypothetical protein psal_cds_1106 [Pandoravirus salinus]